MEYLSVGPGVPEPTQTAIIAPVPAAVGERLVADLVAAVQAVSAFDCAFERTRWFGEDVLWLAPNPDEPFRRLIAAYARPPRYSRLTVGSTTRSSRT